MTKSLFSVFDDLRRVTIGRKLFVDGLGLEKISIALRPKGLIPVDGNFRTIIKRSLERFCLLNEYF